MKLLLYCLEGLRENNKIVLRQWLYNVQTYSVRLECKVCTLVTHALVVDNMMFQTNVENYQISGV